MIRAEKTASVFCGLLLLAYLISSFFPQQRLWGINHLAYFPIYFRVVIITIGFLFLFPNFNRRVSQALSRFYQLFANKSKKRFFKYGVSSLVSVFVFWILRTPTHFLGDGYLRARSLSLGVKYIPAEPLDSYLHFLIHNLLSPLWGGDSIRTYAISSCVAGGVFIFVAILLAEHLGKTAPARCLVFIVLTALGGSQLFFGYVESYTLMYVAVLIYLFLSLNFLERKMSLIWPTLFLGLALSLHLSTFYLLPSLAYLYWLKNREEIRRNKTILNSWSIFSFFLLILGLGVGIFVLRQLTTGTWGINLFPMFLSIKKIGNDPYTLFSWSHVIDFINELQLLSPVGFAIWSVILFVLARQIKWKNRNVIFLGMISLFSLVYTFVANPKLACARDWDMFAPAGLGYTLLGLYLLVQNIKKEENLKYVLLILSATAMIGSFPWFYLNSREAKSLARFNNILNLDPERSAYGHEILARYYGDLDLFEKEAEEWRKAIALEKNPRYFDNLGVALFKLNRYDEAITQYKRSLDLNPRSEKAHYNLGLAYSLKEMWDEAINEYREALKLGLRLADLHAELGIAYGHKRLYREGISELKKAIQINSQEAGYYYHLGSLLFEMKYIDESIQALKQVLTMDSTYSLAYKTLGNIYMEQGKNQNAFNHYQLYIQHNPQADDKAQIEQIMSKLKKN